MTHPCCQYPPLYSRFKSLGLLEMHVNSISGPIGEEKRASRQRGTEVRIDLESR